MEQNNQKKLLVLKIIAFESGKANSQNSEQDTCQWQSMCYETHIDLKYHYGRDFPNEGLPEY